MDRVDVIYLAWNRLEFTRATFEALIANTDWSLVRRLTVYDDGSTDHTREYLDEALRRVPVQHGLCRLGFKSPVKTMIHYLKSPSSPMFAKLDNDIAVPAGWLDALMGVMERSPELEILGMQAGFGGGLPAADFDGVYGYEPADHIGGVGLMRVAAFDRPPVMHADGRFGFTAWQERSGATIGWITPELACPQMDLLPIEPWRSLSERYKDAGWQRGWPPYNHASHAYWDWLPGASA